MQLKMIFNKTIKKYIWPIEETLTNTATSRKVEIKLISMKGKLYTTQNSRTSTSLSKSVQWHIQDKNKDGIFYIYRINDLTEFDLNKDIVLLEYMFSAKNSAF